MGLGFYVTNSNRRVRVGDRVIFTNHIYLLQMRDYETRILVSTFPILIFS